MSLGFFYKQTEKILLNDIVSQSLNDYQLSKLRILNIYSAPNMHVSEYPDMINMCIGNEPDIFVKNMDTIEKSLGGKKFHVINCRFSLRQFMMSIRHLYEFLGFITRNLKTDGIFMGFLLDTDKVSGLFTDAIEFKRGNYGIEYVSQNNNEYDIENYNSIQVIINGELNNIFSFSTLETICNKFGMYRMDKINLEYIYKNSLNNMNLDPDEKLFGFLNYVFLFRKL